MTTTIEVGNGVTLPLELMGQWAGANCAGFED